MIKRMSEKLGLNTGKLILSLAIGAENATSQKALVMQDRRDCQKREHLV
jgi:hypothetical protein